MSDCLGPDKCVDVQAGGWVLKVELWGVRITAHIRRLILYWAYNVYDVFRMYRVGLDLPMPI